MQIACLHKRDLFARQLTIHGIMMNASTWILFFCVAALSQEAVRAAFCKKPSLTSESRASACVSFTDNIKWNGRPLDWGYVLYQNIQERKRREGKTAPERFQSDVAGRMITLSRQSCDFILGKRPIYSAGVSKEQIKGYYQHLKEAMENETSQDEFIAALRDEDSCFYWTQMYEKIYKTARCVLIAFQYESDYNPRQHMASLITGAAQANKGQSKIYSKNCPF